MNTTSIVVIGLVIGGIITACSDSTPKKTAQEQAQETAQAAALKACMDKHRWDTSSVQTSRLAVAIQFERMGKGELAKHISDREAVQMVYCTPKRESAR